MAKKKPILCDWCGPDCPTPAVRQVTLTDMDGVLLDTAKLCESCCNRWIVIDRKKSLDAGA